MTKISLHLARMNNMRYYEQYGTTPEKDILETGQFSDAYKMGWLKK